MQSRDLLTFSTNDLSNQYSKTRVIIYLIHRATELKIEFLTSLSFYSLEWNLTDPATGGFILQNQTYVFKMRANWNISL